MHDGQLIQDSADSTSARPREGRYGVAMKVGSVMDYSGLL